MAMPKPNNSSSKRLSQVRAKAGMKGGEAGKGEAKARSSEQASKAAKARWAKWREERGL